MEKSMKKRWMQIFVCLGVVLAMCQGLFCLNTQAKNKTIYVAFKDQMPFYQFTDEQGQAAGMHVDIMNAIAKELEVDVVYIPAETNQDAIALLESGEAELILGIPYYWEGDFNTTSEISSSEIAIMAPKELVTSREELDFSKYIIALEFGVTNPSVVSSLRARQYIFTGSQVRVLDILSRGRADVMMCDKACMEYLLREKDILDDYVVVKGQLDQPGYTIALEKNNSKLRREIENALMTIRLSGEYEIISAKWIPAAEDGAERLKKVVFGMAAVFVIVSGAVSVYVSVLHKIRNMLEKEVAEKTKALNGKVLQLSYESELRNRIIEHSPNGMVLVDWDGTITLINKSACQMAEVVKTEVGTSIYSVKFFEQLLSKAGIHDRLTLFRGANEQTLALRDSMNEEHIYQLTVLPTYNEEYCNGALLTIEDITAKEEQRIAAAEKEKNQVMNRLIAGIAHEIKNPLTGIRNFAELIRTKRNDSRFLDYFAELVPEEVDRISRLVESLMQYARPPKGKRECINLSDVLMESMALMNPLLLGQEEVVVATSLEENLFIFADRDQIKQVFINLFMNGFNAVERKLQKEAKIAAPAIKLTAVIRGEFIIVHVLDYGDGMTPEEVEKCTEPFFTTSPKGTGLGLAMSKRFIQENEGTMWIDSEKGVQTCITVRFRRYEK